MTVSNHGYKNIFRDIKTEADLEKEILEWGNLLEKDTLRYNLDTSGMSIKEIVKFNLKKETLKNRFNYYALCLESYIKRN